MILDEYMKTAEFAVRVRRMFPIATSAPLHKVANLHNPHAELNIQQAVYGLSKKAYIRRRQWDLIHTGIRELENI